MRLANSTVFNYDKNRESSKGSACTYSDVTKKFLLPWQTMFNVLKTSAYNIQPHPRIWLQKPYLPSYESMVIMFKQINIYLLFIILPYTLCSRTLIYSWLTYTGDYLQSNQSWQNHITLFFYAYRKGSSTTNICS